ncbi:PEPxxWA-CTERM sorting domain-containing protein [Phenylobacterium sp.]|uniref:PEPxxWA-CTERM sorting domain-containing protein n=1 Tax=Phenylobacterium sp. TaxID=1871053 RepID=UPI001216DFF5|nr:PEPxxWA-CTERM sorting domain-containing protein [Phenylobacterium sp.]THD57485.1 MAG: PEP-CTERM sorting domain-containing protein [Phenylobacterium sp.]
MKLNLLLAAAASAAGLALGASAAQAATVTVNASDDLYNLSGASLPGDSAVAINVTGLTSLTFSASTGATVTVNGGNYNDADGAGSVSGEFNTGANGISGITTSTAGFLAGTFVSGSPSPTAPTALDFSGGTSFASLSPLLQQAFFIGDGLTGDATGATQTFYVPTGATTLFLGLTDACGYSGAPSCFSDNFGSFSVTTARVATGAGMGGVPEPASWALMIAGFGGAGAALRQRRRTPVFA